MFCDEFLIIQDALFLGGIDKVYLRPMIQADCFHYVVIDLGPTIFPISLGIPEDPSIPFLPYFPKEKSRE
jgi:hypothetical protein